MKRIVLLIIIISISDARSQEPIPENRDSGNKNIVGINFGFYTPVGNLKNYYDTWILMNLSYQRKISNRIYIGGSYDFSPHIEGFGTTYTTNGYSSLTFTGSYIISRDTKGSYLCVLTGIGIYIMDSRENTGIRGENYYSKNAYAGANAGFELSVPVSKPLYLNLNGKYNFFYSTEPENKILGFLNFSTGIKLIF